MRGRAATVGRWSTSPFTSTRSTPGGSVGIGTRHAGTDVRILIHDLHVTVIATQTGEILRDLVLDPTRDYQPRGVKPGPPKGGPQRGGR